MATQQRRAVITGLGIFSPIGMDADSFWKSIVEGRSGIRPIKHMDVSEFPCRIAGDVPEFTDKFAREIFKHNRDHAKSLKMMARTVQLGVSVAQTAMVNSGIAKSGVDPTRVAVEFGAAIVHTEIEDIARASKIATNCQPGAIDMKIWGEKSLEEIPPLWMLKYLPNMPACHVSIMHDIQGPSNTITVGDASSVLALCEAFRIMQRNLVDFVLVGGTESKINPLNFVRQMLFQPVTPSHNDSPATAVRPFDRDRDGMVLGEGAAAFGIEELEHARKRNATIFAEVCGFASGFDRDRQGKTLARVIRKALADAGITPADVDHINAHGMGTQESDRWEANAIREVFGQSVPVWGLKGFFGALGPASGVIEMLGSILALRHGVLPPMLNCENPDPELNLNVHSRESRAIQKPYVVKINFSDLGQVGAIVLRRWDS